MKPAAPDDHAVRKLLDIGPHFSELRGHDCDPVGLLDPRLRHIQQPGFPFGQRRRNRHGRERIRRFVHVDRASPEPAAGRTDRQFRAVPDLRAHLLEIGEYLFIPLGIREVEITDHDAVARQRRREKRKRRRRKIGRNDLAERRNRLPARNPPVQHVVTLLIADAERIEPRERNADIRLFIQEIEVNRRILRQRRQQKKQRSQKLRRRAVHPGRPAGERPFDRERTFAVGRFDPASERSERIEKSGHQPGPQALVAIETDRKALLRAKPGQHPHAGAGVAEVERPPRIGKNAAGSGDLPDIVVFADLRAKQPGGLEGRARVGRLERRDEHACAVRGQRRRNAADRVGLRAGHRDFAAEERGPDQKLHLPLTP